MELLRPEKKQFQMRHPVSPRLRLGASINYNEREMGRGISKKSIKITQEGGRHKVRLLIFSFSVFSIFENRPCT